MKARLVCLVGLVVVVALAACKKPPPPTPTDAAPSGGSPSADASTFTTPTDVAHPIPENVIFRGLVRPTALVGTPAFLLVADAGNGTIAKIDWSGDHHAVLARGQSPTSLGLLSRPSEAVWSNDARGGSGSVMRVLLPGIDVRDFPVRSVRTGATFTGVAVVGEDIFFAEEVDGKHGAVTRVTGTVASRLAEFAGVPRAVAADAAHVYVATSAPPKIVRSSRLRGELTEYTFGAGAGFSRIDVHGETFVLGGEIEGKSGIFTISKLGTAPVLLAARPAGETDFARRGEAVYFLDRAANAVVCVNLGDRVVGDHVLHMGEARTVATSPALSAGRALVLHDDDWIYVATDGVSEGDAGGTGAILRFAL